MLSELIITWATDTDTGRPIYIFELGSERFGAQCRCTCASCGRQLTAVNAGKSHWDIRPHFRHPKGALRDDCAILTARAAMLRQLDEEGWITLPGRSRSGRAKGLSGHDYTAWVEAPGERVRIRHVSFRDRVSAILTLDDGRKLRVSLTGAVDADATVDQAGAAIPTIFLRIDDPAVAGMGPDELRSRLALVPDAICWHSHWRDAALKSEADEAASAKADLHLDAVPPGLDIPQGLDPALRRQTVLHYEVQRILAASSSLRVPGFVAELKGTGVEGEPLEARIERPEAALALSHVALEQRAGQVIPDVTCSARAPDGGAFEPLFVEVTVTNTIGGERRARIRDAVGAVGAALEIHVGSLGGTLTRDRLRQIVLEELDYKRWLWRPEMATAAQDLQAQLAAQQEASQARADQKAAARDAARQEQQFRALQVGTRRALASLTPEPELAAAYLEAFIAMQDARKASIDSPNSVAIEEEAEACRRFAAATAMLKEAGYPNAGHPDLVGPVGILARLCSIKLGRCVYRSSGHWLDIALDHTRDPVLHIAFFGLYTAAVDHYGHDLDPHRLDRFNWWKDDLRKRILQDERYLRPQDFDQLLELVFPELQRALASKPMKRLNERLDGASTRRR